MNDRLRVCNSRKCFISIFSTWYSVFILILHSLILKEHIKNILNLYRKLGLNRKQIKEQSWLEHELLWWEHEQHSSSGIENKSIEVDNEDFINIIPIFNNNLLHEFTTRVCLTTFSALLLILFLICSLKKIGNFSNDGVKFGRDFFCEKLHHHHKHYHSDKIENIKSEIIVKTDDDESLTSDSISTTSSHLSDSSESSISTVNKDKLKNMFYSSLNVIYLIWRHFLPINSFLHLLSILFLILPDMIFKPMNFFVNEIKLLNTNRTCFRVDSNFNFSYCLLDKLYNPNNGVLTKLKLNENGLNFDGSYLNDVLLEYKLEILSFSLAFMVISVRYGSVFWYTNKILAYLISLIGFVCAVQQLSQLYSFVYISRQIVLNQLSSSLISLLLNKMNQDKSEFNSKLNMIYKNNYLIDSKLRLTFLYSFLSLLVLLALIPIYTFSYLKYKERFLIEESLFLKSILKENFNNKLKQNSKRRKSSMAKLDKINFLDHKLERNLSITSTISLINKNKSQCCFNYCPHLIATVQLILICCIKLPFCYDYIIYFNNFKDFGLMCAIIIEILHTIILLFIWLILTLKTEWSMHLRTSFSICHWTYHLKLSEKQKIEFENKIKLEAQSEKRNSVAQLNQDLLDAKPQTGNNEQRKLSSSDYYLNSETLYRNELRKSMRNMLQQKRNSSVIVPTYYQQNDNNLNKNRQLLGTGLYYSATNQPRFTTLLASSYIEIPIQRSSSFLQQNNFQKKPVLYLNRPTSSEYESRV